MNQDLKTNKAAAMPSVTRMRQISGRNPAGRVIMHTAQAITPRPSTSADIIKEVVIPVKEVVAPIANAVNVLVDTLASKATDTLTKARPAD